MSSKISTFQARNFIQLPPGPPKPQELDAALAQKAKLIGPSDLPATLSAAQRHTALGFQAKGLEFTKAQARMREKLGGWRFVDYLF